MHVTNLNDDKLFFIAYFSGVPVEVLQLNLRNPSGYVAANNTDIPKVEYFATHCGIRNCGIILIEYVVNESLKLGKGGRLKCTILEAVRDIYLNMGFTELSPQYMQLDPNESPV
ncbi:N-acetyltransferase [Xenorhabdus mauleonii]|uniref:N-acetyltransferase n=1 Tax=Xenorhabdus mauleonii TaxID=351675 RepID=A0A1I3J4L0_9GAMM|nr:hypothetical protein [Xenorhabdus mauleonii]PHM46086.1 N-acetyltransferase [Xenorhabdus mauleonii]SFI54918.1 hypothetical protein SAMN05421680_10277 [Xenorhabdus mauleonii]